MNLQWQKKLVYTKYESFFIVNKQFTWGTKTNDTNYGKEVKLVKKEKRSNEDKITKGK